MDLGLDGKVAWVHGASAGLGRASALALAREGAAVAVSARRADALDDVVRAVEEGGGRALAVPLDVTDAGAIGSAHERVRDGLGEVDVLVANAGGPPAGGFADFDDDALHAAFELTTASAWRLTNAVLPAMRARRSGCLVYLTSSTTKEVVPALLLSNMMRAAVVGMMKTLSKELGPDGVRALCVAPGRVDTDRVRALDDTVARRTGRTPDDVKTESVGRIPLGRYGEPAEFGDVVAFLASERASYVTGVTVVVDGGMINGLLS
ncbi:MAG TPA: SDR family oxidoreductase [Actinomycetota bacterium]|nr:SDR family oxidoreductase [Actinomycetota bacterium]